MNLDVIIRESHSGVRWLVVLATIVAIVWLLYGLVTKRSYDQLTYRIMTFFSSVVGLQWIVGVIFFIYLGTATRERWEHAFTMTIVLIIAHVHMMLKKRDDRTRFIGGLASVVVALGLVYVGVATLPQGW